MRVRLTEIRLRPTGKKVRLDRDLELESLFIGRGPDNDLSLKGLTISLHQATIRMSEGRVYVEAAPGQEVNV
ncbi:MAG: FHA domain-containing protein, partial [Myxococcota bacterium]